MMKIKKGDRGQVIMNPDLKILERELNRSPIAIFQSGQVGERLVFTLKNTDEHGNVIQGGHTMVNGTVIQIQTTDNDNTILIRTPKALFAWRKI
jgi:predicted membrane GTPase involved in stress response